MDELRIVSLLPSATEIVCGLGLRSALVGRSHECDFPHGVETLPVVTRPRAPLSGSSREIDAQVRELARQAQAADALGVYEIDLNLLRRLAPTHIITQTQCEVCAVSLEEVERAVAALVDFDVRLVSLAPNSLDDIWADIERAADALGRADSGREFVRALQRRIERVRDDCAAARTGMRPRVVVIEWADPLMTAGHWTMELVELAGGEPLIGAPRGESLRFEWDDLASADPDVIIIAPCGYDLDRTRADAALLSEHPRWGGLRAAQTGRVAVIDGNQYINRPGPRVVESLEIIAEILHPGRNYGHRDAAWEPTG